MSLNSSSPEQPAEKIIKRGNASHINHVIISNTSQVALAAKADRTGFVLQNTSDVEMRMALGGSAAATTGFLLSPGASYASEPTAIFTGAISIYCGTAGKTFTTWEI